MATNEHGLNESMDRFCLEYVKDLNATQAAIRSGYAKGSAGQQAAKMLKIDKIQKRIRGLMKQRQKRLQVSGDMVVQRLANLAFGNIGMVCVWTDKGLDLKNSEDLTEEEMAIIAEIQVKPVSDGNGGLLGYDKKVKMRDSLKALEMLAKHLGMFDGKGTGSTDADKTAITGRLLQAVKSISGK